METISHLLRRRPVTCFSVWIYNILDPLSSRSLPLEALQSSPPVQFVLGQFQAKLACQIVETCLSVTYFDLFLCLSLPLPSTYFRTMMTTTTTIVKVDSSCKLSPFTVTITKNGKLKVRNHALSAACSLGSDETVLVAEIYNKCIILFLEEPTDSLSLIRDNDELQAIE